VEGGVMSDCWVYKAFYCTELTRELLYVGISDSPTDRMSQHSSDKWWWHLVNKIEWEKLESRGLAKQTESAAIRDCLPLFNKQESILTSGQTLLGCLRIVQDSFHHCPLCLSGCKYTVVSWQSKSLCKVDVGGEQPAYCFEVWMSCDKNHSPIEWCQLIPVEVLCQCRTKMPERVLADLWIEADSNGEVGDDIPHFRPPTLAELFLTEDCQQPNNAPLLVEAS
jgi:hypothetical protein